MIQNSAQLKEYIECDIVANKIENWKQKLASSTLQYLIRLRKLEYHTNCNHLIRAFIYRMLLRGTSLKTGITIPINTFEKGLYIPHHGCIVVNGTARFGDSCQIQCGVNISENSGGGRHIYFGAGAKIMENIYIADDVIIGANAVVTHSIYEPNTVWAGVPAKKISNNGFASNRTHF